MKACAVCWVMHGRRVPAAVYLRSRDINVCGQCAQSLPVTSAEERRASEVSKNKYDQI